VGAFGWWHLMHRADRPAEPAKLLCLGLTSWETPSARVCSARCMHACRVLRKIPDMLESFVDKAVDLLNDRNHGVLLAGQTAGTRSKFSSWGVGHGGWQLLLQRAAAAWPIDLLAVQALLNIGRGIGSSTIAYSIMYGIM
jgi:hypothetical protein